MLSTSQTDYSRNDISIYYVELPYSVSGFVKKITDNHHAIVLNSRLSHEENMRTLTREIELLERNYEKI